MEASTLRPAATLPKPRITVGAPLLRLRSDEQLVALFRAGHDEAFRAIHDRYHRRLFAYARQMLPGRQDAEDVLQDVFVRAYAGLRASDRELALRAWLFRVAHNRCIDQLRKPSAPPPEVLQLVRSPIHDPLVEIDLRESLRRLVEDIRRLPDQQRSALLMRELGGMSYADLAISLGISVGAVKSLLVRARLALAQASEARDTACAVIREQLVEAHDRGVRPNANVRKHVRDCGCCKSFRRELRGVSRQLAGVAPAVGPLGFAAKLLGFSGGGGGAGGAALLGSGGTTASAGGLAVGGGHVATLLVAAVATAGGAVEIQRTILPAIHHGAKVQAISTKSARHPAADLQASSTSGAQADVAATPALSASVTQASIAEPTAPGVAPGKQTARIPAHGLRKRSSSQESSAAASTSSSATPTTSSAACSTTPSSSTASTSATTSSAPASTTAPSTTGSIASSSSTAAPAASACGSDTGSSTTGTPSSDGPAGASNTATTGAGATSGSSDAGNTADSGDTTGSSGSSSNATGE